VSISDYMMPVLCSNIFTRVVRDARLYTETITGYVCTYIFATDEVIARWPPIEVPDSQEFRQKAFDMKSPTIGVNFSVSSPIRSLE
jgi:hypothetical protein